MVPSCDSWRGAGGQFLLCMRAPASDKRASGEQRTDATFRNWVKVGDAEFPPEAGRYHLYISHACPWANRCNTVMHMKGLTDVIGLSVVHPTWARSRPDDENDLHCGWQFKVGCPR
jgi:glutathionyl-hydroquinone reductase